MTQCNKTLGLIKICFFAGLVFLPTLPSVNFLSTSPLSCISMNNQECKVRPRIVNVNSEDSVYFPCSIKTSKCSGDCNNINNSYAKLCVTEIVKNLNIKVFNLMSKRVSVKIDQIAELVIINNAEMMINADINAKIN